MTNHLMTLVAQHLIQKTKEPDTYAKIDLLGQSRPFILSYHEEENEGYFHLSHSKNGFESRLSEGDLFQTLTGLLIDSYQLISKTGTTVSTHQVSGGDFYENN